MIQSKLVVGTLRPFYQLKNTCEEDCLSSLHIEPIIFPSSFVSSSRVGSNSVSPVLVLLALCHIGVNVTSWALAHLSGVVLTIITLLIRQGFKGIKM